MLGGTTNVPAVDAVGRPSVAVGGVFVDEHFGARRGHWSSIEIKHTIELGFGGQLGVDSRGADKVQCLYGLVKKAVPEMERKLRSQLLRPAIK